MTPRLAWTGAALALLASAQLISSVGAQKLLPPIERPSVDRHALLDAAAALMGTRRLGADLAFIQLLHLVSKPLEDLEMRRARSGGTYEHPAHGHDHGQDPTQEDVRDIFNHSLRPANLDPYFHYSYLFGSGLLAFYLNAYGEALDLLKRGIERDPTYWRFRLYAGAIGYRSTDEMDKAIPLLEEAVRYPDCPTMILNILGNLYEKKGEPAKAAELYRKILSASRDDFEIFKARRKLESLGEKFGS